MPRTPEEEAELQELQALLAQMPDDEVAGAGPSPDLFGTPKLSNEEQFAGGHDSTFGNVLEWGKNIFVDAPVDAVKGLYNLGSSVVDKYNKDPAYASQGFWGLPSAAIDTAYDGTDNLEEKLMRTRDITASVIPGARTALQWASGDPEPAEGWGTTLRKDVAAGPLNLGLAMAPKAIGAIKGVGQVARDALVGMPEENILAGRAIRDDGTFANSLNVASKRTHGEDALIMRAEGLTDNFTENNPVANLNPNDPTSFTKFQDNLNDIEITATQNRNNILPQVAYAESQISSLGGKVGTTFDEIPTSVQGVKGPYGPDLIRNTVPGGDTGVPMAIQYVKNEFGILDDAMPSRALSVEELNTARMRIDNSIREWGGWDDTYLSAKQISPSTKLAYIETLKFYRNQVDNILKAKISKLINPQAAETFTKAGKDISMSKTYSDIAGRFQRETGQAFTPGSAKALPPGQGPMGTTGIKGKVLESVAPGLAKNKMQTDALFREGNAIRELQALIDFRTGQRAMPAPRGWAQIKNSMEHLTNIGFLAERLGLIGMGQELANVPDEIGRQITAQVAASFPQMFEQNPDKINVIDNKYMDSFGKDLVMHSSNDLPDAERAKRIGGIYENKYVPPTGFSTPPPTPPTQAPFDFDTVYNSLDGSFSVPESGFDASYDKGTQSMIQEMERAIGIHNEDF